MGPCHWRGSLMWRGVAFAALRLAQVMTRTSVVAVDVEDETLAAAADIGARVVDARAADAAQQIRRLTNGGAVATIDLVGAETSATLGFTTLAAGGVLVIVGLFGGQLHASLPLWPLRNLTVRGSYVGSLNEMRQLMSLVQVGAVPPIPVRPRSMAHAQAVLNDLREGGAVGRMVLTRSPLSG